MIEEILSAVGSHLCLMLWKSLIYKGFLDVRPICDEPLFRLGDDCKTPIMLSISLKLKSSFEIVWHYPQGCIFSVISLTIEAYQGFTVYSNTCISPFIYCNVIDEWTDGLLLSRTQSRLSLLRGVPCFPSLHHTINFDSETHRASILLKNSITACNGIQVACTRPIKE